MASLIIAIVNAKFAKQTLGETQFPPEDLILDAPAVRLYKYNFKESTQVDFVGSSRRIHSQASDRDEFMMKVGAEFLLRSSTSKGMWSPSALPMGNSRAVALHKVH